MTEKDNRTTCAHCTKLFIKAACNLYKLVIKGKTYHYCSYTCWNDAKKANGKEVGYL